MVTRADVRRIALALPETGEDEERFAFYVRHGDKRKGIAWVWLERVHPKKGRVPNPEVLAVRVASEDDKHLLIASDPDAFFTEPHYNGYPAVLVRLANVPLAQLETLLRDAWQLQSAPRKKPKLTPKPAREGVARNEGTTKRAKPTARSRSRKTS